MTLKCAQIIEKKVHTTERLMHPFSNPRWFLTHCQNQTDPRVSARGEDKIKTILLATAATPSFKMQS